MTTSTRCQHRFCLFIWSPAAHVEYFFFFNCQKFRDTVPLKPVKPIAHLSAFHVVDIVKVNDGDGFSGSTRHFFLRFLGSLQQQKNKIVPTAGRRVHNSVACKLAPANFLRRKGELVLQIDKSRLRGAAPKKRSGKNGGG